MSKAKSSGSGDLRNFFAKQSEPSFRSQTSSTHGSEVLRSVPDSEVDQKQFTSSYFDAEASDLGNLQSGPSRPVIKDYPLSDFYGTKRGFTASYFEKYEWLEYSVRKDAVFCYVCRQFPSNSKENLYTEKGMQNWKKLGEKLKKHEISACHLFSMSKWINFRKPTETVATMISASHREFVNETRDYLKKVLDILLYLGKQGLAFRGHDESSESKNKGNYLELCELFCKYDAQFKNKYERYHNFMSPGIQNELLEIVKEEVLKIIVKEVNDAGFFSLMVDEAKSHRVQQLSICIRYLHGHELKERVLTMIDVSLSRTADSLASVVLNFLTDIGINSVMVGQSHDGASVMSGVKNGLQTIIRQKNPFAMYVHCLAHKLNLVLVTACKDNDFSCHFFNVVQSLYEYFSYPDTHAMLKEIQNDMNIKSPGPQEIGKLSDTRWACRARTVIAVKTNFLAILEVLSKVAADFRHSKSSEAKGLLMSIKSPDFIVCLVVFEEYLSLTNVLSKALQKVDTCIAQCAKAANGIISQINSKRNDKEWSKKWEEVKDFAKECKLNIFPVLNEMEEHQEEVFNPKPKRPRMISNKLNNYAVFASVGQRTRMEETNCSIQTQSENYKRNFFFPVLDVFLGELRKRFTGDALRVAESSEQFLRLNEKDSKFFIDTYYDPTKINRSLLKSEMSILKNIIENSGVNLKDSPLKTIVKEIKENVLVDNVKELDLDIYPNMRKLLKVCLTLPSNSATCERSFSAMRRINNWLRCAMNHERFSDLMIIYSEADIVKNLDKDVLIDIYNSKCSKRKITSK